MIKIMFPFFLILLNGCNGLSDPTPAPNPQIESPFFDDISSTHLPGSSLTSSSMDVEVADVDGDGDLDLIIATEFKPNVLLLNDGTGKFHEASGKRLPAKNFDSEDVAIADFDGDSDLDIIFVSEDNQVHEYYLNDGTGAFLDVSSWITVSSKANAIVAADFDGDGYIDIILGNDGQNLFLANDGTGKFVD
jgi:hypothetical protein